MSSTLLRIPGIGKTIAEDLHQLGIEHIEQLIGRDPQALYDQLSKVQGEPIDRCMLYVFRCAVYYAETPQENRDPSKLKWWKWKE